MYEYLPYTQINLLKKVLIEQNKCKRDYIDPIGKVKAFIISKISDRLFDLVLRTCS